MYECPFCKKRFKTSGYWNRHKKSKKYQRALLKSQGRIHEPTECNTTALPGLGIGDGRRLLAGDFLDWLHLNWPKKAILLNEFAVSSGMARYCGEFVEVQSGKELASAIVAQLSES